ncbi:MAG: hypothetical protein LBG94_06845 [Treponema sp.]|nr:hypothetical protein [Treponema sp.]
MAQTDGKWEIKITAKVAIISGGKIMGLKTQDKIFVIEKPTYEEAIRTALMEGNKHPSSDAVFKEARTIREPSKPASSINTTPQKATPESTAREAAETVLSAVSASSEFAGLIAEVKKLQKLVSKLGGAGKIFSGIDAANEIIKFYEVLNKYSQTTDKKRQKELLAEGILIIAKMTKIVVTVAFPPAAIVDAGFSTIALLCEACQKAQATEDKKKAGKAALDAFLAVEAKYVKEAGALTLDEKGYCFELGMYRLGATIAEIKERRRVLKDKKDYISFSNNPPPKNPYKHPLDERIMRQSLINSLTK